MSSLNACCCISYSTLGYLVAAQHVALGITLVILAAVENLTTCYYDSYHYYYHCYQYLEWANWTVGSGGVLCVLVAILLAFAIKKKAYYFSIRAFVGITILVAVGYIVTASILVSEYYAGPPIFLYCISVWLFIMTGIVAKYGQLMIAVPRAADPAFVIMTNSAPTSQIHVHPQQQTNIINQAHTTNYTPPAQPGGYNNQAAFPPGSGGAYPPPSTIAYPPTSPSAYPTTNQNAYPQPTLTGYPYPNANMYPPPNFGGYPPQNPAAYPQNAIPYPAAPYPSGYPATSSSPYPPAGLSPAAPALQTYNGAWGPPASAPAM
ncbi:non-classical arabinogalactan protein 31 isoform X1 [Hyalella azteca]|uniref:Non-classical arabinogalactan protein 31 isoform X1 n=2 Tax=Hyalella azteca TaxID=294128 RepID=A0A8B7P4A1_HYAAZ|nr:non-classical arabinogalactan protein 31 isoform X1 [Hyalella azteca]XP_018020883.1 non-classical arabinogalactan protein 31 isoform X1 [Hyalella azteca]